MESYQNEINDISNCRDDIAFRTNFVSNKAAQNPNLHVIVRFMGDTQDLIEIRFTKIFPEAVIAYNKQQHRKILTTRELFFIEL